MEGKNEEPAAAEAPAGEPAAVEEAERERAVAAVHPAIEGRAGVPVDRTTIGFPEASVEIHRFQRLPVRRLRRVRGSG